MAEYNSLKGGFYTNVDQRGGKVLYRGYDIDGKRIVREVPYTPTLYAKTQSPHRMTHKSLYGDDLEEITFDSISDVRKHENDSKGQLYGNKNHKYAFLQKVFPNDIKYNRNMIAISSIDIETQMGVDGFPDVDNPIVQVLTICVKDSRSDTYIVFGTSPYEQAKTTLKHLKVDYREYQNEPRMLEAFIEHWSTPLHQPDVITGWNSYLFDIPYLIARSIRLLGEKKVSNISPFGSVQQQEKKGLNDRVHTVYKIVGVSQLDYMDLFKKFGVYIYGTQESYKLDHIAQVVLGKQKLAIEGIREFYLLSPMDYIPVPSYQSLSKEDPSSLALGLVARKKIKDEIASRIKKSKL